MNLENTKRRFLALFAGGILMTQVFQNCGQLNQFDVLNTGVLDMSSSSMSDINHPSQQSATPPSQKILVVDKFYVGALMRDLFTSAATPVPNLEYLIQQWVVTRPAQYGASCNPYDSYSGRDCGGDIANSSLPMSTDASTLRESYRLQFCQNVLGYDQAVTAVLEKIDRTAIAPDANSIGQIYLLFYRGQDVNPSVVNALVDLDRTLAVKPESTMDRWRAVILQICESPGWQML
jgi:hypothetical protein